MYPATCSNLRRIPSACLRNSSLEDARGGPSIYVEYASLGYASKRQEKDFSRGEVIVNLDSFFVGNKTLQSEHPVSRVLTVIC